MEKFSEYNMIVEEIDRNMPRFSAGNLTDFMKMLSSLNVTTVYVEPYEDGSRYLNFYFVRNNVQWQCDVSLKVSVFGSYSIH
jgi:hypothetical protein